MQVKIRLRNGEDLNMSNLAGVKEYIDLNQPPKVRKTLDDVQLISINSPQFVFVTGEGKTVIVRNVDVAYFEFSAD